MNSQLWRKAIVLILMTSLIIGCYLTEGQLQRSQERLDDIMGEAELIVGAEHGITAAKVSPDGRWLMARRNKSHAKRTLLVDLENREFYVLDMDVSNIQWLDDNHVHSINPGKIVRVPDLVWWELEFRGTRRPNPDSLEELVNADHIVAINNGGSSLLMTTYPELPYLVGVNWDKEELEANLVNIPHTIIRDYIDCPRDVIPIYLDRCRRYNSPDGRYYVEKAAHPTETKYGAQEVIFNTQTDERVAHLYKHKWWLGSLGWAPDSSGAYFEVIQGAVMLDESKIAYPIYKLLVPGTTPGPPIKQVPLPEGSGLINGGK